MSDYIHPSWVRRQNLDKAINMLGGILKGIAADGVISPSEIQELVRWKNEHIEYTATHPFSEIVPKIVEAIQDGAISDDEREDILWLCNNLTPGNMFYDALTSAVQSLHGLLHGLLADGVLTDKEIRSLAEWVDDHQHLRGGYPFEEINSLLTAVLADGKIDDDERATLTTFFSDFASVGAVTESQVGTRHLAVTGVCAACPEIVFSEKLFCFTGESRKAKRREIHELIEKLGGVPKENVLHQLNYLVVGAGGHYCWAYACYGRKIELAMNLRREGFPIMVVHESDFWDAVGDLAPKP